MEIATWINQFLSDRGLEKPDGRPLYAYKTTAEEYRHLRTFLQMHSRMGLSHGHIGYARAWLLFAAEWWRQEYAGGPWRWKPLCEAAGQIDISYNQTIQLVNAGQQHWGLPQITQEGGKKYLGFVAVNGGLPMRLIESAQGGLSNLLRMVTQQALRYGFGDEQLRQAIESQAELLPRSYQQTPVYELLEKIVSVVIQLRANHGLSDVDDPLETLKQVNPDWENLFPITLDSQAAESLVKGLVTTASTLNRTQSTIFKILRGLRFSTDDSNPVYEISFEMKAQATRNEITSALGINEESLPPNFQILLQIGEEPYLVGEAILRRDQYQLIAKPFPPVRDFFAPVHLVISRWGATIHLSSLVGGEALSKDEPMIFEDNTPYAELLAQGDAVIKGNSALALVPDKTIYFTEDANVAIRCNLADEEKRLLKLTQGTTRFRYRNQPFVVSVNPAAPLRPQANWQGQSLNAVSVPGLLICGQPRLRIEQEDGVASYAPSHELFVRYQGNEQPINQMQAPGLCRLVWRKDGQRLLSTRAVVLPSDAKISYMPGANATEGRIHLANWPNVPVYTDSTEVYLQSSHDNTGLTLSLHAQTVQPGRTVNFYLQWPDGEQRLTLPFPAYGASFVKNDRIIGQNETVSIDELIGCRVLLMSLQGAQHWVLRMTCGDVNNDLSQDFRYTGVNEIRMFELIPAIQQMLSCFTGLDHLVKIEVIHNHQTQARLNVGRYSSSVSIHTDKQSVSLNNGSSDLLFEDEVANDLMLALSLAEPEQDVVSLTPHRSEGVFTGSWVIDLPSQIAGPWLLYTVESPIVHSRPTVYVQEIDNAERGANTFEAALCNPVRHERISLMGDVFYAMSLDPTHRGWDKLEILVDKLHHLPLASLDIFQVLIGEPQAMAMATLVLDDFASRLAERLPKELPFEWLLISPKHWLHAIKNIREQINSENNLFLELLVKDIQRKSAFLTHWQPALEFIFKQGLYEYFNLQDQEARLFAEQPWMLGYMWLDNVFVTNDIRISEMQQMLNRNANLMQDWPALPKKDLKQFAKTEHGENILARIPESLKESHMLSMILLPFMVAIDAYEDRGHEWQSNPQRLFTLRQARQFDPVWFDSAYEMGLVLAQIDLWD